MLRHSIKVELSTPTIGAELSNVSLADAALDPDMIAEIRALWLKHKVLFGSDYPWITPDRWLADFEKIAIRDEVRPLILKENAMRLFGLR